MAVVFSCRFSLIRIRTELVYVCNNASSRSILHRRGEFPYFKIFLFFLFLCLCCPQWNLQTDKLKVENAVCCNNLVSAVKETFTRWARSSFWIFYPFISARSFSPSLFSISNSVVSQTFTLPAKKSLQSSCSRPSCTLFRMEFSIFTLVADRRHGCSEIWPQSWLVMRHAVAQLVQALRYKPEGRTIEAWLSD
jgi:hypothetical protein